MDPKIKVLRDYPWFLHVFTEMLSKHVRGMGQPRLLKFGQVWGQHASTHIQMMVLCLIHFLGAAWVGASSFMSDFVAGMGRFFVKVHSHLSKIASFNFQPKRLNQLRSVVAFATSFIRACPTPSICAGVFQEG